MDMIMCALCGKVCRIGVFDSHYNFICDECRRWHINITEEEEEVMEAKSSMVLELAKDLDAKYIEAEVEERVNDALDGDAVVMFAKASAKEAEEEFDMSREVMHLIASKTTLEEISKIRDLADSLFIALHEFYRETAALVELAGENDREVLFNRNIIDDTWSYILPAEYRWEAEFKC